MSRDSNPNNLDWLDYIPSSFGNREDDDPIVLKVRFVTAKTFRHYQNMIKQKTNREGMIEYPNRDAVNRKMLADNIEKVTNYSHKGKKILNGADIWDLGESELINEMLDVIDEWSKLSAGMAKNFKPQSDSLTQTMEHSGETAENVSVKTNRG